MRIENGVEFYQGDGSFTESLAQFFLHWTILPPLLRRLYNDVAGRSGSVVYFGFIVERGGGMPEQIRSLPPCNSILGPFLPEFCGRLHFLTSHSPLFIPLDGAGWQELAIPSLCRCSFCLGVGPRRKARFLHACVLGDGSPPSLPKSVHPAHHA